MPRKVRALAVRQHSLQDPRHLMRFMKMQSMAGTEQEKIAAISKSEGVSEQTVKSSVKMVEGYRAQNDPIELQLAMRDMVISAIPRAKSTLQALLIATELVEFKDEKTGKTKVKEQADKTTQLEALRIVKELIAVQQPKQAPVEVNVNQTTQVANNHLSTAETPEERMRRLREKAREFNALPPTIAAVPDSIDSGDGVEDSDDGDDDDDEDE